jgi:hypothetical protein
MKITKTAKGIYHATGYMRDMLSQYSIVNDRGSWLIMRVYGHGPTFGGTYRTKREAVELLRAYNDDHTPFRERMRYANQQGYSDVNPYEIVRWVSDKTIEVRAMRAEVDPDWKPEVQVGGFSRHVANQHDQRWFITSDPEAPIIRARKRIDGYFHSAHGRHKVNDRAVKFYDYNF